MILITGASGNVGSEIVRLFQMHGENCCAGGRKNIWQNYKHVQYRYFDFEDSKSYGAAKGIDQLFLVRPPQISNIRKTIGPFLRRCKEYGVTKVVFLSIIGVEKLPFVPHHAIEKEIRRLGFDYSFLRAGFFMQNLSTTHAKEIRERNELVAPCGKGKTTFIHTRDIGETAYKSLMGGITCRTLDVVGKDTLTYQEIADKMTVLLGRKITYRSPLLVNFIRYRVRHGTPFKFAFIMAGIYMPTRFGAAEYRGTTTIDHYLGRPPTGFDQFLREEKMVWE